MVGSFTSWASVALGLAASVRASPVNVQARSVTSSQLSTFNLMEQYAAASYCTSFDDSAVGTVISCSSGSCPGPQSAGATLVYGFDNAGFGGDTGYIALDNTNKLVVLAFRGSESLNNWIENLDFVTISVPFCSGCEAHDGFWNGWTSLKPTLVPKIQSTLSAHPGYSLIITGHSLGGALATLAATDLRSSGFSVHSYTFGSPRVGNTALANFMTSQASSTTFRITHTDDIVPQLPPEFLGFAHASPEYWITSGNNVQVGTNDITVIQGVNSNAGNAGTGGFDTSAHEWYFNAISSCN